ncbi:MAG: asparagine synthase (glutamine-hydrolyzing) [Endomicrobiia bacterium]|nr:asparagine synthase (glutamine-hydrolyzing) [Endomicrobiia bacterium]
MCGIAGVYNFGNNKPVEKAVLQRMCDSIKHRGPDDEGYFFAASRNQQAADIGLGMRRLAIIDLITGSQPIHNEDKTLWIVLNGEIYNFEELRRQLEPNHKFYTKTDTEVILHLYEEHGERCVDYLIGMFAFAVWDAKGKKLFIAKDRAGKKPLYYMFSRDGAFVFASEIKAILSYPGKTHEIDPESIDLYLTYQYIPSPKTIFKDIKSLPPAHTLVCDAKGNIRTERYWDIDFRKKTDLSFQGACLKTRELLSEATKLRMISDVPLGAFLSGGHDSSIVVGLMSELSPRPVKTFSIGFEEDDFSELRYANIVAKHFGTEHNEFIVRPDFIELLPGIVRNYGQPFADSSALPSYVVSNQTRKHVTVALNGDGGDEAFGGYLRYKAMKGSLYLSLPFKILGKNITAGIAKMIPHTETTGARNIFRYMSRLISALAEPPQMRHIYWHCIFTAEAKDKLYSDFMKGNLTVSRADERNGSGFGGNLGGASSATLAAYDYLARIFKNAPADDTLDRAFYTDIMSYLPECLLVKMDIASMANSLEARSPFLDHKVMEFSATLPSSWKVHGLTTKHILKKTFAGFLPDEIITRPKQGFGIPVGKWFRGRMWRDYFREIALSERAVRRGYFRRESLEAIFNEHITGRRDHGYRLWSLLMLELWHRIYIDGERL